uniref:MARVEL domain-containing protein n=1 Tax=Acrobeloides nanus TaxID=290746 RepID=A0A914CPP8_9BILA
MEEEIHEDRHPAPGLPEKFNFDQDDPFYLAPPTCKLIHYRHAAIVAGVLEVFFLVLAVYSFTTLNRISGVVGFWPIFTIGFVLIIATITTGIMIYGILIGRPHYLWPQMAFLTVEIVMTLIGATIAIISMSFGLEFTYNIFSPLVNVHLMEKHFGPIWPFNIAIVSFSTSALGIWFHVIVQGCYEYMLDKEYFMGRDSRNIEMKKNKN